MTLNEFWRAEYRRSGYLSHLSDEQLDDRTKYLMENLTTLESNGKIGLRDISKEPGRELMRAFTHILEEFNVRKTSPQNSFLKNASVPKPNIKQASKLLEIAELAKSKRPHLIKFGLKTYLQKFSFKVSLASTFSDPSLNTAQMDDEIKAAFLPQGKDVTLTTEEGHKIEFLEGSEFTLHAPTDYYIFCSSHTFDYRLFGDFEADSCLFIYDSHKFSEDIIRSVNNVVHLDDFGYKPVQYLDPIKPKVKGRIQVSNSR